MAKSKAAAADFSSFVRSRKPSEEPERAPVKKTAASGQKLAACRVTKAQWEKLQHYCIAEDTSVQAIVSEALEDWFRKKGLPW